MITLTDFFKRYDLTQSQIELVEKLELFLKSDNKVFLLRGYAGTGKTFITKGLTEYLAYIKRSYILAAPTGKAAKVIAKKTNSRAYTIHKTIYTTKDIVEYQDILDKTFKFYYSLAVNENPSDTLYIVDEASMISDIYSEMEFIRFGSGYLLKDFMHYINLDCSDHRKKVVFIGDNAQLPPVGMNFSPALDKKYILENFGFDIEEFELKDVVRQKDDSGILKNTLPIRKSLQKKVFNQLDIDTNFEDIEHIEHENFAQKYIDITNKKIDHQTMVIAYSNASVKEYNDRIRQILFPGSEHEIRVGDKIMSLMNNANYEIFISNGDFGIIEDILSETETRHIVTKNRTIDVKINFKDVVILFYDIDSTPVRVKCKIIENLLYSEQPNLSSDENKAIYVDFVMRHKNLKPNTKEWKDALKSDPYFNALRVKFGYAITCHKAQGSEWKNVFLNCKSHQSILSQDYFRWLYTAITRASCNLYVLDEPHVGIFSNIKISNNNIVIPVNAAVDEDIKTDELIFPKESFQTQIQYQIYIKIAKILKPKNISILDIVHNQYCEQYTLGFDNETSRVNINYNSKNQISKILFIEQNILSKTIQPLLCPLEKSILDARSEVNNFQFKEDFLRDFYENLNEAIKPYNIQIINIKHLQYNERYMFRKDDMICILDFYFNKKGCFSTCIDISGDSQLSGMIKSIIVE